MIATEDNLNPLKMIGQILYDTAGTVTGIVGLTPLQVVFIALGILGVLFVWQIYAGIKGRTSFHLNRDEGE